MQTFRRYGQSASLAQFSSKPNPISKSRILSSPAPTHTLRNPQLQLLKLPQLNSMRRSGSLATTQRNTKFKLQNLQDKIQELAADVRNTRLDAQETFNTIHFMTNTLANKELGSIREDLRKSVQGLERVVNAGRNSDQVRSGQLRDDCVALWKETESMRQMLFQIRMRTDQLDLTMGYKKDRQ